MDFSDADVLLLNSVTFPEEVLEEVATKGKCLKPSAKIVTAKTLLGNFKLVATCWAKVSWSSEVFEYSVQQLDSDDSDETPHPSLCKPGRPMQGEICAR